MDLSVPVPFAIHKGAFVTEVYELNNVNLTPSCNFVFRILYLYSDSEGSIFYIYPEVFYWEVINIVFSQLYNITAQLLFGFSKDCTNILLDLTISKSQENQQLFTEIYTNGTQIYL